MESMHPLWAARNSINGASSSTSMLTDMPALWATLTAHHQRQKVNMQTQPAASSACTYEVGHAPTLSSRTSTDGASSSTFILTDTAAL